MNLHKLIDAYTTAFWREREDIIGDDYETEKRVLDRRLSILLHALENGLQSTIIEERSFLKKQGQLTPEVEELLAMSHSEDGEEIFENKNDNQKIALIVVDINEELKRYFARYPHKLHDLSPRKFEELIADILCDFGFDVDLTPATRDGGKDIYAYIKNQICSFLMFIECKKWSPTHHVGIEVVQRLYGVQQINKANKSMIVTTSFFTKSAIEECKRYETMMILKDYNDLKAWLQKYKT